MKSLLCWVFCGLALWGRGDKDMTIFNETKLSALREILAGYCPGSSSLTCDNESQETTSSEESCCIRCSCDKSCGLHGNCCYEEDDIYKLEQTGSLRCILPATTGNTENLHMYKFVVGPPVGGCVDVGSCNISEELIPLKTFYPVFSRSKKMSYISEECSHCHGVTDGTKWTSIVTFLGKPTSDLLLNAMFDHTSERAYLVFVHPGHDFENIQGICSDRVQDTCLPHKNGIDFEVRTNLRDEFSHFDIQTSDIINGCLYGPKIPYLHKNNMFRNVFCLFCNRHNLNSDKCIGKESKVLGDGFSTILDFEHLDGIPHNTDSSQNHGINPFACKVGNRSFCRPVFCPTMQLRTKNGDCKFSSRRWYHPNPSIYLNLTMSFSPYLGSLSNVPNSILLDAFYKNSPWHKCWRLQELGWRSYQQRGGNVTEFVLRMACDVYETDPFRLMNSVQHSLSKEWIIQTDEGILSLHQELLSTRLEISNQENGDQKSVYVYEWYLRYKRSPEYPNLTETALNLLAQAPSWDILMRTSIADRHVVFLIQKHFFCFQIQLRAEEYEVINTPPLSIKYIPLQAILFYGKITGIDTHGEINREVKICLEDSDFEIVKNKAAIHTFTAYMDIHVVVILYFFLS